MLVRSNLNIIKADIYWAIPSQLHFNALQFESNLRPHRAALVLLLVLLVKGTQIKEHIEYP